jgi:limonene-1,2-epoxide hydrolase
MRTPLDTVTAFMKAMEPLDYDQAVAFVAEDCVYTNPPPIGTVKGPAGIRAVLEPFFAPTLENEFRTVRAVADGPIVMRHRLTDKWVELPVTGVYEVHDGSITYWRDYFDVATIMSEWPNPA